VIRHLGECDISGGTLLNARLLLELRRALPAHMDKYNAAVLRYRMSIDGTSLLTLIARSAADGIWILLFQTENRLCGVSFQGSLNGALAKKGRFVDQGAAMAFCVDEEGQHIYKKSQSSDNAVYSVDGAGITFGRPKAAVFLGEDFRHIHSSPRETFDSPALVENIHTGARILETELFLLTVRL
jgi:hypothetical protein